MKILRLKSENVKRLTAVDITPDGALVIVGGKNAQGKSSVLDAIAMALGGKDLAPAEPIRTGEARAEVEVDLGDVVVTRKFKRDKGVCTCGLDDRRHHTTGELVDVTSGHTVDCGVHTWSEITSTLTVKSKDGLTYPSPQAMLDKLIGKIAFDPLKFATEEPKRQRELLRQVVRLDTTDLDEKRKDIYTERTLRNKQLKELEVAGKLLPRHPEVAQTNELSSAEVASSLERADELRRFADVATRRASEAFHAVIDARHDRDQANERIDHLTHQLKEAEDALLTCERAVTDVELVHKTLSEAATVAKDAVPDTAPIIAQLNELTKLNALVRENATARAHDARVETVRDTVDSLNVRIAEIDAEKQARLAAVEFPVKGLGLTDDGVTFNGVPFEQASTSEQIEVSVNLGLALNPKLRVLLVRNGNVLDDEQLAKLGALAARADAQVWVEYVTSSDEGVSVFIEDGHVA